MSREDKEREQLQSVTTLIYYFDKAILTYRLFDKPFDSGLKEIQDFIESNNLVNDPLSPSIKGMRQLNRLMDKCRSLILNAIDNTINLKERIGVMYNGK